MILHSLNNRSANKIIYSRLKSWIKVPSVQLRLVSMGIEVRGRLLGYFSILMMRNSKMSQLGSLLAKMTDVIFIWSHKTYGWRLS